MKKTLLLILAFGLFGCSSIELEAVSSSDEETQRILALGLSHEQNLLEAKKLKSDHMISVVTLQLVNARDEENQYQNDLIESRKIADMVIVSEDGISFTGPKISNTISDIISTSSVLQNYYLEGLKNLNNGVIEHKLHVTYFYNASKPRGYSSVNLCDDWGRCETLMQIISVSSLNFSNCTANNCDYSEVFELDLSNKLLKNSINKGLTMNLISNNESEKINLPVSYLMGYLGIAI
jgi:hypothetical protein